jgi:hypothetical protein
MRKVAAMRKNMPPGYASKNPARETTKAGGNILLQQFHFREALTHFGQA